jgi:SAM-dependent methyltransferase
MTKSETELTAEKPTPGDTVADERWAAAQRFERQYWTNIKQNGYLGLTAEEFAIRHPIMQAWSLAYLGHDFDWYEDKTVVDVGCGPMGPLAGLTAKRKFGIDPLLPLYQDLWDLDSHGCTYLAEQAESMSLDDNVADVVVCDNMLDHVQSPRQVLAEVRRILRADGELFLALNLEADDDQCHPHGFDLAGITSLLLQSGFQIQKAQVICHIHALDRPLHFTALCKVAKAPAQLLSEYQPGSSTGGGPASNPATQIEQLQAALAISQTELNEARDLIQRYEAGWFIGTMAKISDLRRRFKDWIQGSR